MPWTGYGQRWPLRLVDPAALGGMGELPGSRLCSIRHSQRGLLRAFQSWPDGSTPIPSSGFGEKLTVALDSSSEFPRNR